MMPEMCMYRLTKSVELPLGYQHRPIYRFIFIFFYRAWVVFWQDSDPLCQVTPRRLEKNMPCASKRFRLELASWPGPLLLVRCNEHAPDHLSSV